MTCGTNAQFHIGDVLQCTASGIPAGSQRLMSPQWPGGLLEALDYGVVVEHISTSVFYYAALDIYGDNLIPPWCMY